MDDIKKWLFPGTYYYAYHSVGFEITYYSKRISLGQFFYNGWLYASNFLTVRDPNYGEKFKNSSECCF